jgi:hypothetical protein
MVDYMFIFQRSDSMLGSQKIGIIHPITICYCDVSLRKLSSDRYESFDKSVIFNIVFGSKPRWLIFAPVDVEDTGCGICPCGVMELAKKRPEDIVCAVASWNVVLEV